MNKNEIIDAVLACWDREGTVSGGVHVDRFVALCRVLPSYRDVAAAPVVPAADETTHPVPEPVVEPVAEPVVETVVEAPVEPVVAE
jgi:hypothetical protein